MRASVLVGGAALLAALSVLTGWIAPESRRADALEPAALAAPIPRDGASTSDDAAGRPLTVLLMGDSYTAGNGARSEAGDPAYYGPERCMRSTATWGERYAHILETRGYAVTLLNRACSAATTDAMIHDRYMKDTRTVAFPEPEPADARRPDSEYTAWAAAQAACTPTPASDEYFRMSVHRTPRADSASDVTVTCERWLHAQADALNPDVDLVLFTAGGNDVHFPDIVRECLILGNPATCEPALDTAERYVNDSFADDLLEVLSTIEERTEGHAKIAYLAYPGLEVSDDLTITSLGATGVSTVPVAERLQSIAEAGRRAQAQAVDEINARWGAGTAVFLDQIPALFAGHEPDARPASANPNRWMYEVFETTERDEWYHLKPEGHRAIAEYVASFGDFGATDDNGAARDVAIVVGDRGLSTLAVRDVLGEASWWDGARVSLLEQRVAQNGVGLERRVLATSVTAAQARDALGAASSAPWREAVDVALPARWNAAAQTVYVGDASVAMLDRAPVWSGVRDSRPVTVDAHAVDVRGPRIGGPSTATVSLAAAERDVRERLHQALEDAASVPHAWAGGPYVATGSRTTLTAGGSVGQGSLQYAWDLDGDGEFETTATGPDLRVPAQGLHTGWVSVRVVNAGGLSSVAWAWVASAPDAVAEGLPCVSAESGGAVRAHEGRQGCRPESRAGSGPDAEPMAHGSSLEIAQGASGEVRVDGDGTPRRVLAALSMVPLAVDERVAMLEQPRRTVGSRRGDRGRARPRELVRRERALTALLASEVPA